ncbi:hypothetical protein F4776DRAFT_669845 [Hypoxylon sp. NC0597]|nr:hypothetical protein F4776DRAFT_669845 [Hypoxylon sp. NC0597]
MASQAIETTLGTISTTISFLGPLPTTFSAPTTCGTTTYTWFTGGDTTIWEIAPQTSDDPTCLPPNWVVNGYYSPGLCPYGYTNACSMTNNGVETTVCCPTNQNFGCYSTLAYDRFVCSSSVPPIIITVGKFAPRDSMSFRAPARVSYEDLFTYSRQGHFTSFEEANSVEVSNSIEIHDSVTVSSGITISDGTTISSEDPSIPLISPTEVITPTSAIRAPPTSLATGPENDDDGSESTLSSPPSPTPDFATSESVTVFPELPGHTLWAYSIQIQRAISTESVPLSPSDISTISSSATTISSRAGSGLPDAAPLPSNSTLSVTASVGIAVGILGALIFGAIASYLFMRGRRGRSVSLSPRLELDGKSAHRFSLHELDEQRNPSEMPAWDERNPQGPNRQIAWELPA